MSALVPDLDAPPAVAGGGPAPRRRRHDDLRVGHGGDVADGLRRRTGASVPRATLLDDRGRAWAVTYGRDHVTVRLPDEVHEGGAAFCLVVLAHLDGRIGSIAEEAAPARSGRRRRRARV